MCGVGVGGWGGGHWCTVTGLVMVLHCRALACSWETIAIIWTNCETRAERCKNMFSFFLHMTIDTYHLI